MMHVRRAIYTLAFPLIACLIMFAPSLHAQQTLGSINGTVVDSTGAAIPGATVTVVNNATSLTRKAVTRNDGTFQILNLSIGSYKVTVTRSGFQTESYPAITVRTALATTVPVSLKVGSSATTIQVNANPLLDNTDTTNGYTLDKSEIQSTPLATGSFTQLAILAPGTSADFLSGVGTNQGLGNQNIWANGQRATDNTYTVNGVSITNLFNGMSASQESSQRFNFNIGEGSSFGGQSQNSTSVYGSNGNGLASPPPEFMDEVQVTTSMYGADQGGTSGAQITVNTSTGTNHYHGQLYGHYGTNALNAVPYFYKQDIGLGSLDPSYANPSLHKWIAGGTVGGPIIKDKLFFFLGYQHLYTSDQFGALSRMQVPFDLTDDRSTTGIENALCSYFAATSGNNDCSSNGAQKVTASSWNSSAVQILQAKLPNGSYLIPSAQGSGFGGAAQANLANGFPDVSQVGTSRFRGDQATASLDFNATSNDHLTAKYYYQHTPAESPFSLSNVLGFPGQEDTGAQVASLNNSINIGTNINWEQRIGFSRQKVYSTYSAPLQASNVGISVPGGDYFPGLTLSDFAQKNSNATSLGIGPNSDFVDDGYFQNRFSPSSNAIFSLGKHNLSVGFNYDYTQLNIRNNRTGHSELTTTNFASFLQGSVRSGTVLEGVSSRHYRNNDAGAFVQDKWQMKPNLSLTAGIRYDFNGPFREANGLMFNFDPSRYESSPSAITNSGFIVAGNNKQYGTPGVSDSTLKGRQWGLAPRVGIAWSPTRFHNKVVWRAGAGIYYNRGEYFQYLSPPAGNGISGPFGVTQEAPFAAFTNVNGNLSQPFTTITPPTTPANIASQLPTIDQQESECDGLDIYEGNTLSGYSCEAIPAIIGNYNIHNVLPYSENWTLDFQWQPRNNTLIDIAYVGNRGKHEIVPLPFNEPGIATPSHPINGQIYSYGVETISPNLDGNGNPYIDMYEPYDTYSGGNVDLRVPYTGYDPNSTSFTSAAISSYDALQARVQRRMSHGLQFGVSYTWSHTLDEQSDIGLFFTGDNPNDLRSSYADADFARTNVTTANFVYDIPSLIRSHGNWLHYATNGWSLEGITIFQSGQPYSVYDFSGSVGNEYFGGNVSLLNPVLPLRSGISPKQAETGHNGAMGQINPQTLAALNASDFEVPLLNPGQNGVPPCDTTSDGGNAGPGGGPLCDVYETTFVPGQRNIFRQAFQKRADITIQKTFQIRQRYGLKYQFEVFNVTNTPSFDVPNNNVQLSSSYLELSSPSNPNYPYANGTQVQPSGGSVQVPNGTNSPGTASCQGSSQACAYELYTVPTNSNTTIGVVTNTIGSNRIIEMALHLTF